ncbi:PsiF family protein [Methylobacterium sp. JK268]
MRPFLPALAVVILACLPAAAKDRAPPAGPKPAASRPEPAAEDSYPGVDPAVLAQCRSEAESKHLRGEPRQLFMKTCVEPED